MKSYFGKLAARATLANVSASRPANAANAADPFEETGVQRISNVVGTAQQNPIAQSPVARVASESQTEISRRRILETDTTEIPTRNARRTSTAEDEAEYSKQLQQLPLETPITLERRETEKRSRAGSSDSEESEADSTPLPPQVDKSSLAVPIRPKEKDKPQSSAPFAETSERLSEIESEQRTLLRKADAFMAGLFVNRQGPGPREESEAHEERQMEPERTEPAREAAPRLQPIARAPRVAEPVGDETSVVIGKLSVEILPAQASSPTPPQIVVVRGGGQRARSPIGSSQRFGFSRF